MNYNFFSNFNCTCAANALAAVGLCTCNNRLGSTQSRALPQQRPQNNLDNISTLLLTFFEFRDPKIIDVAAERGDGRGGGAANAGGCLCRRLWSAMAPCAAWPEGVADAAVRLPCAAGASMPSGEAVGRYHGYNS